jgi:regulator of RNase E activity RraA
VSAADVPAVSAVGDVPPVSAIADVLALWGDDGWLTPPLSPVVAATRPTMARVRTVLINAAATGPGLTSIYDVMSNDLSGCFVVIAGAHPVLGAVWGEILTYAALQQNATGALVDGYVRDLAEVTALGLPLYASDRCAVGPNGRAHVIGVDVDTVVGGVTVGADDVVVADATGCVRMRAGMVDDVIDAARRYAAAEAQVVRALVGGEPLATAYRYKKSVVTQLKEEVISVRARTA